MRVPGAALFRIQLHVNVMPGTPALSRRSRFLGLGWFGLRDGKALQQRVDLGQQGDGVMPAQGHLRLTASDGDVAITENMMEILQRNIGIRICLFLLMTSVFFPRAYAAEDLPLVKEGGVYKLPVEINKVLTLHFILDTGASDVQIPADVTLTLLRTGTIQSADFLPGKTYMLADGSAVRSPRLLLRSLKIGTRVIQNVPASVGDPSGALLLGQSMLERLGTWSMDSQRRVLALGPRPFRDGPGATRETATKTTSQEGKSRATLSTSPLQPPSPGPSGAPVEIPAIKAGDTYIIESLYPDTPALSHTTERKVVSVNAHTITVTAKNVQSKTNKVRTLQFTAEWNLLSSRNADGSGLDYLPPLQYFAFPLYPGKTWQQQSRETNVQTRAVRGHTISAIVGAWEEVVPAGTFRALKITLHTELFDPATEQKSTGTDISWYAPDIRRSVKSVITSQNFQGQQERRVISLIQQDIK